MFNPDPFSSESELLKSILEPLLDDFQYWLGRSRSFLETQHIAFLGEEKQSQLLDQVKLAQQEIRTAQMLMKITGHRVGLSTSTLMPWHRLVTECWQVSTRWRQEQGGWEQPRTPDPSSKPRD